MERTYFSVYVFSFFILFYQRELGRLLGVELCQMFYVLEIGRSDLCQWRRNSYLCNGGVYLVHTLVVVLDMIRSLMMEDQLLVHVLVDTAIALVHRDNVLFSPCVGDIKTCV